MSLKSKIITNFFFSTTEAVVVTILEDNKKAVLENAVFESLWDFADCIPSGFEFDGGNSRECYITNGNKNYTIQVSAFEFFSGTLSL